MNIPYVFKKCSKCGEWLVASSVNFYKHSKSRDGLDSRCKKCLNSYGKERRAESRKMRESRNEYKPKTKEQRLEFSKMHKEKNDNNRKLRQAQYQRQYRQENKEVLAEYYRQYRQTPQGQVTRFNSHQRRRAKEQKQGSGITKEQWLECMIFFDWKCAYSGKYLGGSNNKRRSIDHIIALNNGGVNEVWNLVPMIKSLNSSKQDKDMMTWYTKQDFFSEERLNKIKDWQEYAYNKWGK